MAAIAFGGSPLAVKLTCVAMRRWQPARCCGSTALCLVARIAFTLCPIRAHCQPRKLVRHPVGLSYRLYQCSLCVGCLGLCVQQVVTSTSWTFLQVCACGCECMCVWRMVDLVSLTPCA